MPQVPFLPSSLSSTQKETGRARRFAVEGLEPRWLLSATPVAAALQVADFCVGNDTGMVNVSAAVGTPTHVIIGARSTLDHDPATLHNVKAGSLAAITVDQVLALVLTQLQTNKH